MVASCLDTGIVHEQSTTLGPTDASWEDPQGKCRSKKVLGGRKWHSSDRLGPLRREGPALGSSGVLRPQWSLSRSTGAQKAQLQQQLYETAQRLGVWHTNLAKQSQAWAWAGLRPGLLSPASLI